MEIIKVHLFITFTYDFGWPMRTTVLTLRVRIYKLKFAGCDVFAHRPGSVDLTAS